ncbi:Hypothetical Protein FCC1311_110552 [Hondaea fermentalgiana]|uniref:Uncharacterized protein n=1 Tax=Hondaea fermentalgiana TaxID=2315210 RepID=A0A2R5H180_9STRA|nr:Hypothetical Protein FCC1311_110552 [Hondaea fermentalgiana]|eukprot:GBG34833.1 Hypothetical Protein FCC1311_110552 [Hondaea fermentalgiana]
MLGLFAASATHGSGGEARRRGSNISNSSSSESLPAWRRRRKAPLQSTTPTPVQETRDDLAMVEKSIAPRRHRRNHSEITQTATAALKEVANLVSLHHNSSNSNSNNNCIINDSHPEQETPFGDDENHMSENFNESDGESRDESSNLSQTSADLQASSVFSTPDRVGRRARIKRWLAKVRDDHTSITNPKSTNSSSSGIEPKLSPGSHVNYTNARAEPKERESAMPSPVLSTASQGALLGNVSAQRRRKGAHRRSRSVLVGSREAETYIDDCLSWDQAKQLRGPEMEAPPLPRAPPLPAKHSSSRSAPGERVAPPPLPPFPPHKLAPCNDLHCLNARVGERDRRRPSV